jgi:TDG/mug DNA glycosylase family protein
MTQRRPSKSEIAGAEGAHLADVIAPELKVLFCGINPGLYSGAVGHHFARPGNRFWPALHAAGITDRVLQAHEERKLLQLGYGITNFIERATATASELKKEEYIVGRRRLRKKVEEYQPAYVAILGIGAYRKAFGKREVVLGLQAESFGGASLWVLPNPSGLNAHYQLEDHAALLAELHRAAEEKVGVS